MKQPKPYLLNIISGIDAYAELDLAIIWVLITKDLTPFKQSIQKLL